MSRQSCVVPILHQLTVLDFLKQKWQPALRPSFGTSFFVLITNQLIEMTCHISQSRDQMEYSIHSGWVWGKDKSLKKKMGIKSLFYILKKLKCICSSGTIRRLQTSLRDKRSYFCIPVVIFQLKKISLRLSVSFTNGGVGDVVNEIHICFNHNAPRVNLVPLSGLQKLLFETWLLVEITILGAIYSRYHIPLWAGPFLCEADTLLNW